MDTNGEMNKAQPQGEISSVFKGGPVPNSQDQKPFKAFPREGNKNVPAKAPSNSWNRQTTNPYQFIPAKNKNVKTESHETDKFMKDTGTGILGKVKDKIFSSGEDSGGAKQKVMVILIPILAIIMIFMFRQAFSKAPKRTSAAENPDDGIVISARKTDKVIEWNIPEPMPAVMRDPSKIGTQSTSPQTASSGTSGDGESGSLNVRSILYSDDKPSAVIGKRIVHLNETINGATVIEISEDFVTFEKDGTKLIKKVDQNDTTEK